MKVRNILLLLYVLLWCYLNCYAQTDGQIISKTKIHDFNALKNYIIKTENRERDSILLDKNRFKHFKSVEVYGITYYSDGLKVKGFLLKPKAFGKYPGIIYNRGGSLDYGTLTHHVSSVGLGELTFIAKQGFVVIASQYRGNGGGEGQEEYMGKDLNDVLNLIPILENIPECDAKNIGMFGWSRGGATTFSTLKKTNRIKAAAVGGPAVNYVRIINKEPYMAEWWSKFIPGFKENSEAVIKKRSVLFWVDQLPKNVPILLMHGTADKKVIAIDILNVALQFEKHKIPYRLIMYEGGNHAIRQHQTAVYEQVIRWFDKHLKEGVNTSK